MNDHIWASDEIFCFGSNMRGVHMAGAAKFALDHCGAVLGQGIGRQGMSYAIPTKDSKIETLSIGVIAEFVNTFIKYALMRPEEKFFVTAIGTGLAGLTHEQMAPLFKEAPSNCRLPPEWIAIYLKVKE